MARGRGWAITLGVVDVALLTVFAVLAVGHFSGDDPDPVDPSSPPANVSTDPVAFQMPSGRVYCYMSVDGVVCGINRDIQADKTSPWPRAEGCPLNHLVRLDRQDAQTVCAKDVDVPVPDEEGTNAGGVVFWTGSERLAYGQKRAVGEFTCESRQAGVLCTNAGGQWFNLRQSDGFAHGGPDDTPPS